MSQKVKAARHISKSQKIEDSNTNVPSQKRKEDAKQTLYLNRI